MALPLGWLENLSMSLERWGPLTAITPDVSTMDKKHWTYGSSSGCVLSFDEKLDFFWTPPAYPSGITPIVGGCCVMISRDFYCQIGGFDLGLRRWGCEFIDLSLKVYSGGGCCVFEPSVVVGHLFREHIPFPLTCLEVTYNKLRTAYIHLDDATFIYVLHKLEQEPDFDMAWDDFLSELTYINTRRCQQMENSIRPRDWFARMFLGDWYGTAHKYYREHKDEIVYLRQLGLELEVPRASGNSLQHTGISKCNDSKDCSNQLTNNKEAALLSNVNPHYLCPSCGATSVGEIEWCLFCQAPLEPASQPASQQCLNCQTLVQTGTSICPACGKAITQPLRSAVLLCAKCGAQMASDKRFCTQCGSRLNQFHNVT
jgi:RNA polymerase subunit RPABC4/transcription elongation factor Spt4